MNVRIAQSKVNLDGIWYVIAEAAHGTEHTPCATEAEAVAFALDYYGVDLTPSPKTIKTAAMAPKTTHAKTVEYNTTHNHCTCHDYSIRGGSYTLASGERVCKHIKHRRESVLAVRLALRVGV